MHLTIFKIKIFNNQTLQGAVNCETFHKQKIGIINYLTGLKNKFQNQKKNIGTIYISNRSDYLEIK